jgi:hypothetical protein
MQHKAKLPSRAPTIQEVLFKQDASDMFFNDERVTDAYKGSLESANQESDFVDSLVHIHGFDKIDAIVIAKDFLKRV